MTFPFGLNGAANFRYEELLWFTRLASYNPYSH
jgi:hypothetical protein